MITGRNNEQSPTEHSPHAGKDMVVKSEQRFPSAPASLLKTEDSPTARHITDSQARHTEQLSPSFGSLAAEQSHGASHLASTYASHTDLNAKRKSLKDKCERSLPAYCSRSATDVLAIRTGDRTYTATRRTRSGSDTDNLSRIKAGPTSLLSAKTVEDRNNSTPRSF